MAELRLRDRQIGIAQAKDKISNPERQVDSWLSQLISSEDKALVKQVESGHRLIGFGVTLLGLLFGWLTIMGLFQYDGQGRVNMVYLIIVLVGLQCSLMLLTLIAMLPTSALSWVPGFSSFQQMLKWFSPGRLQMLFARFMPHTEYAEIGRLLGREQKVFADVGKWQIFNWSQMFAVAFNLAALLSVFILIAVKDIAFGWSSTLDIEPVAILGVTNFLSTPWQAWLPGAVPDLHLVEASHYFRLDNVVPAGIKPEILGHWWPFVMLSLVFYGLLPRLFMLLFCRFQLRSAYRQTIRYYPGRLELLERLNSALIETRADTDEGTLPEDALKLENTDRLNSLVLADPVILINWGGFDLNDTALSNEIQRAGRFSIKIVYQAGSNHSLEDDDLVIKKVSKADAHQVLAVLVKSWEPPLGELADFLHELRQAGSPQRVIYLLPVTLRSAHLVQPRPADIEEWQRFTKSLVDPWISVALVAPAEGDERDQ